MAYKMKGSAFKLNNVATKSALKTSGAQHQAQENKTLKGGKKIWTNEMVSKHDKAHREGPSPHEMKSPMKQGGLVECPECNWSIEATGDPGYDQSLLMDHVAEAHLGGSTGPGTPGYVAPKDPWGTSWGDAPSSGGGRKAEGKTRRP